MNCNISSEGKLACHVYNAIKKLDLKALAALMNTKRDSLGEGASSGICRPSLGLASFLWATALDGGQCASDDETGWLVWHTEGALLCKVVS